MSLSCTVNLAMSVQQTPYFTDGIFIFSQLKFMYVSSRQLLYQIYLSEVVGLNAASGHGALF